MTEPRWIAAALFASALTIIFGMLLKDLNPGNALIVMGVAGGLASIGWFFLYVRDLD